MKGNDRKRDAIYAVVVFIVASLIFIGMTTLIRNEIRQGVGI